MKGWKSAVLGASSAVFFALCGLTVPLGSADDGRIYDFFLRFRKDRDRIDTVVFLEVDDDAIAHNGVFPWPRSIIADCLLRLKEYGAKLALFDIEFIDRGPEGVDSVYARQGLRSDFNQSFGEINAAASDIFAALKSGRIRSPDLDFYAGALSGLIGGERDRLYAKARGIAQDNDRYLVRASALFGKSWVTLNLRSAALSGEQAGRRALAEERFSRPVQAREGTPAGRFRDILPALPAFALTAQGAGFTNIEIDRDGIRRRIYLVQKVRDHWYPQLAFAPLLNYLGGPELVLEKRRLILKNARPPQGGVKDIAIPLDRQGRMLLDWPPDRYQHSYRHLSLAGFARLEDIEAELKEYSQALYSVDAALFAQFDPALARLSLDAAELAGLYAAIGASRAAALALEGPPPEREALDAAFAAYVEYRAQSRDLLRRLTDFDPAARIHVVLPRLQEAFPEDFPLFQEEAEYIRKLTGYLALDLAEYERISAHIAADVRDRFCILGRVDTGTTDIAATPFWGEYMNVGTHAAVLDTILSESFISPLSPWWRLLLPLILLPLFFAATAALAPLPRTAAGFTAAACILLGALLLFRYTGIFFGPLGTLLALNSAVVVREIISHTGSEREKSFLRKAFSTYVSGEVVREIIADPSRLQLGGTERRMTALFTDVQGFSGIAERLDPEDLVDLLNRYLTAMSDALLAEKGTIDKFEGDAVIAFFGAPLELGDHALRACRSALAMKRIEKDINRRVLREKLSPAPLLTRIGVNTGLMVAGNMGTENKMNYTIMGNAVNLAARLEGVNKQYGTWILASEDTVREAGNGLLVRKLDRVRVVGISEPVRLYELLETGERAGAGQKRLVEVFHGALEFFERRDWKRAAEGFQEALAVAGEDKPAGLYRKRCGGFLANPPPDSWDGVYNLTEK
ncbi:MAG: adenylate/guanylate cyclase domain-containing protein [Treponema sp.]|jgi:adenylate cyclase|nr:adenylate/guanylate cyclase domain-containing protein [Treponema sp.]